MRSPLIDNIALGLLGVGITSMTALGMLGVNPGEAHHSKTCERSQSVDRPCPKH